MTVLMPYLRAFAAGGLLCLIGQVLIDYTRLTPARILTSYVVMGVILGALGLYEPFAEWAGAGAAVPHARGGAGEGPARHFFGRLCGGLRRSGRGGHRRPACIAAVQTEGQGSVSFGADVHSAPSPG